MKAIKYKKPVQLKIASMSEHYQGNPAPKSGKHNSQWAQRINKKIRQKTKKISQLT